MKKYNLVDKYNSLNTPIKATVWYIGVTVVDKAVSILTQPFVNRILSVEEVGLYGVFQSWHSIFSILLTLSLFSGILEVYITNYKEESKDIIGSFSTLSLIIASTYIFVFSFFSTDISKLLGLKPLYVYIMFFMIIGEAFIQFWSVPKRFEYAYKDYAILTVSLFAVKSVLSVFLAYYYTTDRLLGRIVGLAFPILLVGIPIYFSIIKKANCKKITKYWKSAIAFNLPLIPHYISNVLLSSSDKVMIEKLSGATETGFYTIAYTFSSLCLIMFSAINNAYNPFSMKAIRNKEYNKLSKSTELMLIMSMAFSIVLIYLAPEGILVLAGSNYLNTLSMVPVLVLGIFFSTFYFIFSNIEFVNEKTKYIFPVTLTGAIINILLNYLLIPCFGYQVAAYTTLIGYVIIATSHYFISKKIAGCEVYEIKKILIYLTVFSVISFSAIPVYRIPYLFRYLIVCAIIGLSIFYLAKNKDLIQNAFKR